MAKHPVIEAGGRREHVRAFEAVATGQWPRASSRVIAWLISRRLIVPTPFSAYEVPVPIHLQWCQWCSEQPFAEAE